MSDGFLPSKELRQIEEKANLVFDAYRQLYYEGGISSAYLWDLEMNGPFAGCFLIKKEIIEPQRRVSQGCWDSIHVVEVTPKGKKSSYKLTTTVMLTMTTEKGNAGAVNLSGSLTRQGKEKVFDAAGEDDHVINIGKIIEEMEIDIRNQLEGIYIQKTREVLNTIRKPFDAVGGAGGAQKSGTLMGELSAGMKKGVGLPGLKKT